MSNDAFDGYPNPARLKWYGDKYRQMHMTYPKIMSGKMPPAQINEVRNLVLSLAQRRGVEPRDLRLLDYGSGKGYQYLRDRVHELWGGSLPHCYDPGVLQLGFRPQDKFHGVICCDVLEHIAQNDLNDVIRDILGYCLPKVQTFVYLHIHCKPAGKSFPDGTNLHLTVRDPQWWDMKIKQNIMTHGHKRTTVRVTYQDYDNEERFDGPTAAVAINDKGNPTSPYRHPLPEASGDRPGVQGEGHVPDEQVAGDASRLQAEKDGA